jgi:uncharacterized protein YbjT (DUF2867 family)
VRILVLGANGFIGSAAVARLSSDGHDIIALGRRSRVPALGVTEQLRLDIAKTTDPAAWEPHLAGIDAVVNCAGVLQDAPGVSTSGVHEKGVSALFSACERLGIRRVVHLSAVGVDRQTPTTAFSRSKLAGDKALMALDLDWVILRPSVVVGRAAYGGSALLRGLAALTLMPAVPSTAPLQIVHLDDVVDAIAFFVRPNSPARVALEVVGPKRMRYEDVVGLFRRWMRWPPAKALSVPAWAAGLFYRLGDAVALLGWQPPIRSTARHEMVRGATGDHSQFARIMGRAPRDVERSLAAEPASVQERWFARLYLLKPLVFGILALFWITTGVVSLGPGWDRGIELVMEGGTSRPLAVLAVLSGGLADTAIGIAIAFRRTARLGLYAAFVISIAYAIIGTILVPRLWFDPLGPMLKIGPIMVFNLVALAIHDDR